LNCVYWTSTYVMFSVELCILDVDVSHVYCWIIFTLV